MNEHFQKVTIRNKIREVIELLKEKSHNKITNEKLSSIEESVANWIAHPIFTREESLVASAIFAHGFGKILCTNNLLFIANNLEESISLSKNKKWEFVIEECRSLSVTIRREFILMGGDTDWNNKIRDRLNKIFSCLVEELKIAETIKQEANTISTLFICKKLLDQIMEEVSTDTISKLNNHIPLYRSHYFDFIEGLKNSSNVKLINLYKNSSEIENTYLTLLDELFSEGGKDAIIAITLMSEAFIALTYMVILAEVVNKMDIVGKDRELVNFYRGHIILDGVEYVNSKDTHFEMIQHMLNEVHDWKKFIEYCIKFVDIRHIVHNNL